MSTFGRFRLWTSFESSLVSVSFRLVIDLYKILKYLLNGCYEKDKHLFLKRENGAKSYFRNFPNDPKCLDSEIIGGLYFIDLLNIIFLFVLENFYGRSFLLLVPVNVGFTEKGTL